MAVYHCSIKTISRSAGRSAVGAAAYRAAVSLKDEITGETHNYSRKSGVTHTEIVLPDGVQFDRNQLWNAAERSETRKNSTVAREYELALPVELTPVQRRDLTVDFARHLVDRYGVAADVTIHAPSRHRLADQRNHHAHILTTTRQVTPGGFAAKTRLLDDRKSGEVEHLRAAWADLTNRALERAGYDARVSHKSLEAQGIDRMPTIHLGPAATAMERRGEKTALGDVNREAKAIETELAEIAEQDLVEAALDKPVTSNYDMEAGRARVMEMARKWQAEQDAKAKAEQTEREKARQEAERKAQEKQQKPAEISRSRGPSLGR